MLEYREDYLRIARESNMQPTEDVLWLIGRVHSMFMSMGLSEQEATEKMIAQGRTGEGLSRR